MVDSSHSSQYMRPTAAPRHRPTIFHRRFGPDPSSSSSGTQSDSNSTLNNINTADDIEPATSPVTPTASELSLTTRPPVSIYQYDVGIRLIQLLGIVWLFAGLMFTICIQFCMVVSVGYVTFRSEGQLMLVVCAFVFFCVYAFLYMRSLCGTFARLSMLLWKEKFGAGSRDFILLRWVDDVASLCSRRFNFDTEIMEMRLSYVKTAILLVLLLVFVAAPLFAVAFLYGYNMLIGVICIVWTLGSASIIFATNVLSRIYRGFRFWWSLWCRSYSVYYESRIRAAYVSSVGYESDKNIIGLVIDRALILIFAVLWCDYVFGGFRFTFIDLRITLVISGVVLVLLLLKSRRLFSCYRRRVDAVLNPVEEPLLLPETLSDGRSSSEPSIFFRAVGHLEKDDYYEGATVGHVITVFVLRCLFLGVGFCSLVYMDMTEVSSLDGKKPVERKASDSDSRQLIMYALAFYVFTIVKDLAFFIPSPSRARPFMLFLAQSFQIAVAVLGYIEFGGFTFLFTSMFCLYEFNYRDAKAFWKGTVQMKRSKRHLRAIRNVNLILAMLVIAAFVSIGIGVASGSFKAPMVSLDAITSTSQEMWGMTGAFEKEEQEELYTPPICAVRYTNERVSVIDLATMSAAAYKYSQLDALKTLHTNPRLSEWNVGLYRLDNANSRQDEIYWPRNGTISDLLEITSGLRFVEFVSPRNVSVIAIRGTYKLEDIFQDMYLWSTVGLLQASSYFGTFFTIWPDSVVAETVRIITKFFTYPNLIYWFEMQQIVEAVMANKTSIMLPTEYEGVSGSQVMLTGHSLGGGLASIVAGHLSIPAVVFSAPGLGYSILNYNLTWEEVMMTSVNIVPQNDPVPSFDRQVALVQPINCKGNFPMECHKLDKTFDTLAHMCSDHTAAPSKSL